MKLSEAMMLGSATCKMVAGDWNSCALGAAANAVGIAQAFPESFMRVAGIKKYWPWLDEYLGTCATYAARIGGTFDFYVCRDSMTLEQLADYVRSVEPECGECNQFTCTCAALPEEKEAVHAEA